MGASILYVDLETTGVDTRTAEILQIGALIAPVDAGADPTYMSSTLYRALAGIPPGASKVHGIFAADVADCPVFSAGLFPAIPHADICATFNGAAYDLVILARYGVPLQIPHIDVYRVWAVARGRNILRHGVGASRYTGGLGSAFAWAAQQEPVNAHDALGDCAMTGNVLRALLDSGISIEDMLAWTSGALPGFADFAQKIAKDDEGILTIAFGKNKGTRLDRVDRSYLTWMLRGDFAPDTKSIVRAFLDR